MDETARRTRIRQLSAELRLWQHQYDLLLRYVETRVIELDRLGGRWPAVPPITTHAYDPDEDDEV
jgi:hypothetical protein